MRVKILRESGKTVSRKARARPDSNLGSTRTSPAGSRQASRAPSRYASEAESSDDDINDSMTNSVVGSEYGGAIVDWTDQLTDCINEILDRKRSSAKGRESYLAGYVHLTRHHFSDILVESHLNELVPAILRSIRGGRNREETLAGLKALIMTTLTTQSESIFDQVYPSLQSVCESSGEEAVKVEAIYAMTVASLFGGGLASADQQLLDYLLEIIESDGQHVEAPDNGAVVTAALDSWGMLASGMDNILQQAEPALEAFTEQLDSTDVDVQVSAGINIALIFEALRDYNQEMEEEHDRKQEAAAIEAKRNKQTYVPEPYNPFDMQYDLHKIKQRIGELGAESSKAISKKDRRRLHQQFNSILTSLELGKGPRYSTASRSARPSDRGGDRVYGNEKDVSQELGYRETIRDEHGTVLSIDTWSLWVRVAFLKNVLGGGFTTHWQSNPLVQELFDSA